MGLLGTLLKTGLDVVTAPVEVVKDLVDDGPTDHTSDRLERIGDDLEELRDKLSDL